MIMCQSDVPGIKITNFFSSELVVGRMWRDIAILQSLQCTCEVRTMHMRRLTLFPVTCLALQEAARFFDVSERNIRGVKYRYLQAKYTDMKFTNITNIRCPKLIISWHYI